MNDPNYTNRVLAWARSNGKPVPAVGSAHFRRLSHEFAAFAYAGDQEPQFSRMTKQALRGERCRRRR